MEAIVNFRSLGDGFVTADGRRMKPNTIFRSGVPSHATAADIERLKAANVCYIYDLRIADEQATNPPLQEPTITTIGASLIDTAKQNEFHNIGTLTNEGIDAMMHALYGEQLSRSTRYRDIFQSILNQQHAPFLFHCSAGKDRTGAVGFLLMIALGFSIEDAREEYLRIDERSIAIVKGILAKTFNVTEPDHLLKHDQLMGVKASYIDAFINSIVESHGDVHRFLESEVGVGEEEKAKLRELYLV
ncbi:MAG: tyrosine-protein phosphatase [Bacilli bacterium]